MEVSFSRGKTLKGDNIRVKNDKLILFSFYFLFLDLGLKISMILHIGHMSHNTVTSHS